MKNTSLKFEAVAAGHICLDVIPRFPRGSEKTKLQPGKLLVVGPALMSTGGSVSNTGIALNRLGIPTLLVAKVGDDIYGNAVREILLTHGPGHIEGLVIAEGETTSYSVVISPPGMDRIFLHCPGANDTFGIDDLQFSRLDGTRLFHFGYPPIMRKMYTDDGQELAAILRRIRQMGVTTSLDMSMPDPSSESGKIDWRALLKNVLPNTDIFLPSFEEILYMMERSYFEDFQAGRLGIHDGVFTGNNLVGRIADELIDMGAAIVGIKLGENGLYLRTSADRAQIAALGKCVPSRPDLWVNRELLAPCFKVDVVGTTGSGDSTISGFLAGLLRGLDPEAVMSFAVAVGAFNVEKEDATSGVPTWEVLRKRLGGRWARLPITYELNGWLWDEHHEIWHGQADHPI